MFAGLLGPASSLSRSFYDDSWKESYDLQHKTEFLSENNWCANVKEGALEDIVIHIRLKLKQSLSVPDPEIVQSPAYAPPHPATHPPPPSALPSIFSPPKRYNEFYPGKENGARGDGYALPTFPYERPGSQLVQRPDLNPYASHFPVSYLPQPTSCHPYRSLGSPYGQLPYENPYIYSTLGAYRTPDVTLPKDSLALVRLASSRHASPSIYQNGDLYRSSRIESTTARSDLYKPGASSSIAGMYTSIPSTNEAFQ